ncbi:uncharacterized protein LOC143232808 [Tachypleus tridentatus]|uniref:uncharacterized protein LOC143232808 n=1 Tax=Tachypleus tridentatus TaxID=6853 RepID=UPI003FD0F551
MDTTHETVQILTNKLDVMVNEPCVSIWKRRVSCTIFSWSMVLLLVTALVVGVIFYRIFIETVLYFTLSGNQTLTSMVSLTTSVCIMTFNLEPSPFDDGCHRTDFVLIYKLSSENDSGPHENIKQLFEANLKDEGLELEHVHQVPEFHYSRCDDKKLKRGISGVCHTISNLFASKISKRQQFTTEYRRAREYLMF